MIYITDMGRCLPQSALSKSAQPKRWRLIKYESKEVSGTMLGAGRLTEAPEVTYPLRVKGWHAIHVGYWHSPSCGSQRVAVKVKLKSDPYFITIADDEQDGLINSTLREAFWKYADLTGENIIFAQLRMGAVYPGYLAYLKLEPLSGARVKEIQADRADKTTRVVIPTNDCGRLQNGKAATEADICEQIESYRDSDVGRVDWSVCYGDMTNYASKAGWNYYEKWHDDPPTEGEKQSEETMRTLIGKGLIPHKVAMKHAHALGLRFHALIRTGIGSFVPPADAKGLFAARPDMRLLARDGTPLPKLSYAFPEVRQRMLGIIKEVAGDEVDGVNLCWMRGLPCVGYEQPVADAFRQQYGRDIMSVPDDYERLCRLRAGYLTDFMRQVRKVTGEAGKRRGRPMTVTAMVPGTLTDALKRGCDIRAWVEEKLVDEMIVSATLTRFLHANGVKEILYVGPDGRDAYKNAVIMRAETWADGFLVWDMPHELADHWSLLRQLGHGERLIDRLDDLPKVKRIPLKTVGGVDVTHTAPWGGPHGCALVMYTNG